MSVRRHYLGLALLLIIATGAVLAASALVRAQEKPEMKYGSSQHMHGFELTSSIHLSASKLSGTSNHAAAG